MGLKCPACGGFLEFNAATQKLECPYCDSVFDAEDYKEINESIKMDTYSCRNCGAELVAPKEQIVSYCMYCGGEAVLLQKATEVQKPVGIIPFKCSKEYVKQQYEMKIKKVPFAPRHFHKQEFIEGFRGIYIPYWKSSVTLEEGQVQLEGQKKVIKSRYDLISHYNVSLEVEGEVSGGGYDASEAFDDTIAASIAPFNEASVVPFNESYLSGFYADKATVDPEVYTEKVDETVSAELKKHIKIATDGVESTDEEIKQKIKWSSDKNQIMLFPVWFLTWRNKKRVSYSVMNGETGKLSVEVPVDYGKFFFFAAILGAILSGILCMLPMFIIPYRVAVYSSLLLFISSYIYKAELKKLNAIENHEYDLGSKKRNAKDKDKKNLTAGQAFFALFNFFQYLVLLLNIDLGLKAKTSYDTEGFVKLMIIFQAILMVKQIVQIKGIKNKAGIISIVASLILQIVSYIILATGVQADMWFYIVSMICLGGMIINIVTSIFYINYLATRPVPNFYSREGADNGR